LTENFDKTTLYFDNEQKLDKWRGNLEKILVEKEAYNTKFQGKIDEWATVNKWSAKVN
jgi:hypothetical protein